MEIKNNGNHEIGSLTFSHYYCHETGQTIEQFEDDLKSVGNCQNNRHKSCKKRRTI